LRTGAGAQFSLRRDKRGGAGNDQLDGGTGSDTAEYSDKYPETITVVLNGSQQVNVAIGTSEPIASRM
jgi:hypothetical protein